MMKKTAGLLLLIFIAGFLSSCATVSTSMTQERPYQRLGKQYTVAVIDFSNKSKYGERRLSDAASEILTSELSRSGNFIIVERERLDAVMEELKLQLSGMTSAEGAAEIGEILNCQYMFVGTISNFGVSTEGKDFIIAQQKIQKARTEVDVRIIEVETGAVIYSSYGRGEAEKKVSSQFGVGGSGGYDETLAGDTLRAAISESVHGTIDFFAYR